MTHEMFDVKTLRKNKNLSQQELADACEISQSMVCRIESGEASPSIQVAKKIAPILGVNWWELYEDAPERKEE